MLSGRKAIVMKFLKVLVICLLIKSDSDIRPAFLETSNIQSYGCDGRANLLFASSCPFICHIALPGWIVLVVLIFHLSTHKFHLNSNQRQALKRECSGSSMKMDVKLRSGKAILISVNQCVLGRSLYLKIKKVTGISKLIQMLFY